MAKKQQPQSQNELLDAMDRFAPREENPVETPPAQEAGEEKGKKHRGRPAGKNTGVIRKNTIAVTLSAEAEEWLRGKASDYNITLSKVIEDLIALGKNPTKTAVSEFRKNYNV